MYDYIKTEQKPKWGDFKKQLQVVKGQVVDTQTGEIVDCITVEHKADEFKVTLAKED